MSLVTFDGQPFEARTLDGDPTFTTIAVAVAKALIARFEGLILHPYLCPAGVPTIGYGATYYPNGPAVRLTDKPITKQEAERILTWMVMHVYLPKVMKLCPHIDTPERLAAVVDWTYNLGAGNLAASTMRKRINAGDWDRAAVECRRWVRAAGVVLRGLVRRRDAEVDLF